MHSEILAQKWLRNEKNDTFYKYAYNKNLQNVKKKRKDIDNIALSFTTTCINTSNKVLSFIHDRK